VSETIKLKNWLITSVSSGIGRSLVEAAIPEVIRRHEARQRHLQRGAGHEASRTRSMGSSTTPAGVPKETSLEEPQDVFEVNFRGQLQRQARHPAEHTRNGSAAS
jgi:hypothetical protein